MRKTIFSTFLAAFTIIGALAVSPVQADDGSAHHVVFHVDDNDKLKMNITLNNAANVTKYYAAKGETARIEIVAYGPGLHMLRADTSPVKKRLETYTMEYDNVTFAACGNTIKGVTKKEGKAPQLIQSDSISVVPSGVVQLMIRQDQGWHYIRP